MLDHDSVPQGRRRRTTALLFFGLLLVYSVNGREIGAVDTIGNMLLPVALLRGDGLVLNRFASTVRDHYWVKQRGDALVSRYPVLPALVALPLSWPQLALLDRVLPRWTSDPLIYWWWLRTIAKNAAALVGALTGVLLYRLLLQLGLAEVALLTTFAAALGSNLWVVGSQAPWLHGTVALFLTLSLLLLVPAPAARWRLSRWRPPCVRGPPAPCSRCRSRSGRCSRSDGARSGCWCPPARSARCCSPTTGPCSGT